MMTNTSTTTTTTTTTTSNQSAASPPVEVDIILNGSWVVSGFAFRTTSHNRWLRWFSVAASNPGSNSSSNTSSSSSSVFLDWGTYTQSNASAAAAVFFRYPIRAALFRLTILEYVNHMINVSSGFPLRIDALVSDTEPFGCDCASLATGECCPQANMEVRNNTCVLCMDPTDIHTVMVDGCGRCKPGTRPQRSSSSTIIMQRCVPVVAAASSLLLSSAAKSLEASLSSVTTGGGGSSSSGGNGTVIIIKINVSFSEGVFVYLAGIDPEIDKKNDSILSSSSCKAPFSTTNNNNNNNASTTSCYISMLQREDFVRVMVYDEDSLNGSSSSSSMPSSSSAKIITGAKRQISPQYIQFDRGRWNNNNNNNITTTTTTVRMELAMNESMIRSWARCTSAGGGGGSPSFCSGVVGAFFTTSLGSIVDTVIQRQLVFFFLPSPELQPGSSGSSSSFICSFPVQLLLLPIPPASVEIHHFVDTGQFKLVAVVFSASFPAAGGWEGLFPSNNNNNNSSDYYYNYDTRRRGIVVVVEWDDDIRSRVELNVSDGGTLASPPPVRWSSMRIFSPSSSVTTPQFLVRGPVSIVKKRALTELRVAKESVRIRIAYGLALKPTPDPGDSELLTTISAVSKQPIRLTRLVSVAQGVTSVYTTARGFISDPRRALDLVVACNGMMSIEAMVSWLESGLGILSTGDYDSRLRVFAELSCGWVRSGESSKLYWLIPSLPPNIGRRERVEEGVRVEVDFV